MAISSLVVRSGIGVWGDIAHLITRGLDLGAASVLVMDPTGVLIGSDRRSVIQGIDRKSEIIGADRKSTIIGN